MSEAIREAMMCRARVVGWVNNTELPRPVKPPAPRVTRCMSGVLMYFVFSGTSIMYVLDCCGGLPGLGRRAGQGVGRAINA